MCKGEEKDCKRRPIFLNHSRIKNNMHYYNFHIGDYSSHTRHLSPIEDIAYRRMLDYYYLHEQPIQADHIARKIGMKEYAEDVLIVLDEFFEKTDRGYINRRADAEIEQYNGFKEAGKRGAAKRWGKGSEKPVDSPPISEGNSPPNQGSIPTITHNPLPNNQEEGESAKRRSKSDEPKPVKPPPLSNPGFSELFMEKAWPFYLKVGRGKYKNRESQEVALRQLYKWSGGDEREAVEALAYAVANSYQGMKWYFEHKSQGKLSNDNGTTVQEFGELLGWIKTNPGLRRPDG